MAVAQTTIDALKERMPDYLLAVHGVDDVRRQFTVPWRVDVHPSCKYAPSTHTVIDMSRNVAKDVFQLCAIDFGIDAEDFRGQVEKVAEVLGEHVIEGSSTYKPKRKVQPKYAEPKSAGFNDNVHNACMDACRALLVADYAEPGRNWLQDRGIVDREQWVRFGLGYVRNWHQKDIHPSLAKSKIVEGAAGFVTIPYFAAEGVVHYCVLRTVMPQGVKCAGDSKEICPKGIGRPLYNEHYLTSGLDAIAVAEGPVDAMSLTIMTDVPAVGLGSTSMANRFNSVLYYAKPEARPRRIVLNMDSDVTAGPEAAAKMAELLDEIKVDHSKLKMPPGVKDANEWLQLLAGVA